MKAAIGSTVLIQIFFIFLGIYISFLAISVNYSQAFRTKNGIISIIEQYEGYDENSTGPGTAAGTIDEFLGRILYTDEYIIMPISAGGVGTYYSVTTFISFDFPVVGNLLRFPITGETRVMINK
ncbi:MAG: hypothetical protein ACOXZW_02360 [Bacilli bacterium]|jgi:hypothetical protein|nr:hypothetical protein [Bacilli bacterium]